METKVSHELYVSCASSTANLYASAFTQANDLAWNPRNTIELSMYYKMDYSIGVNMQIFMIEERKMNILLYRKIFPCAQAPKKVGLFIPWINHRGFLVRGAVKAIRVEQIFS